MKFILGKKLDMTQLYENSGAVVPVTKVLAEPCIITQVKTKQNDGYSAIQIGAFKRKRLNKPLQGHLKGKGLAHLKEFRIGENEVGQFHIGDEIPLTVFSAGDTVDVTGISKGRGFQGVVKRWGFSGQPSTRGHKDQSRMPGSSGSGGVQHVFRGHRMGGRMGGDQVTIKNLEVVEVDPKNNWLYIKGAIPGAKGSLVIVMEKGR